MHSLRTHEVDHITFVTNFEHWLLSYHLYGGNKTYKHGGGEDLRIHKLRVEQDPETSIWEDKLVSYVLQVCSVDGDGINGYSFLESF